MLVERSPGRTIKHTSDPKIGTVMIIPIQSNIATVPNWLLRSRRSAQRGKPNINKLSNNKSKIVRLVSIALIPFQPNDLAPETVQMVKLRLARICSAADYLCFSVLRPS